MPRCILTAWFLMIVLLKFCQGCKLSPKWFEMERLRHSTFPCAGSAADKMSFFCNCASGAECQGCLAVRAVVKRTFYGCNPSWWASLIAGTKHESGVSLKVRSVFLDPTAKEASTRCPSSHPFSRFVTLKQACKFGGTDCEGTFNHHFDRRFPVGQEFILVAGNISGAVWEVDAEDECSYMAVAVNRSINTTEAEICSVLASSRMFQPDAGVFNPTWQHNHDLSALGWIFIAPLVGLLMAVMQFGRIQTNERMRRPPSQTSLSTLS